MAPIDDETLDRLLTGHLSARLDGYLGRAEPAFRRRLAEAGSAAVDASSAAAANDVAPLRLVPSDAASPSDPAPLSSASTGTGGAEEAAPPPVPMWSAARPRPWARPTGWLWGAVGTALAAAVAAVFVIPQVGTPPAGADRRIGTNVVTTPGRVPPDNGVPSPGGQPTMRYVHNRTWDEGTYAPDPKAAPVRRVRHQQVEHVRFFDAERGAWVELTVPREDVELFELDTY